MFVNGKEIFKFKADNKNVNFPTQFCLGSIFNEFSATECTEVSLNGKLYNFSVDYNSIDTSDILQGHSQNLKQVPQTFMKVFDVDEVTLTS